ncbi:protein FAR1-related sequence 5, partial [Tanacetum coccineum]
MADVMFVKVEDGRIEKVEGDNYIQGLVRLNTKKFESVKVGEVYRKIALLERDPIVRDRIMARLFLMPNFLGVFKILERLPIEKFAFVIYNVKDHLGYLLFPVAEKDFDVHNMGYACALLRSLNMLPTQGELQLLLTRFGYDMIVLGATLEAMSSIDSSTMNQNEELYLARSKFDSYDELLRNVRAFYYAKGYGISIRDSRKDKYVTLQCALSGVYKEKPEKKRKRCTENKRKRNTRSRLTNCPFQIGGKKGSDGLWVLSPNNLTHNYDPATDMSGHSSSRRLPPEDAKLRKDDLKDRSMVSALFEELGKGGFTYDISHDTKGNINRLFIAHPLSVKLAKVFSNTF